MKFFILFPIFLSIISGSLGQYCPESWKQFRTESCFKLIQQSVTKDNAVAVCAIQDSSSSLASIKSDTLQKFITKYVYEEQGSTQNVWTGGSRTSDGQSFIWADKEALEFENWDVGSPDLPDRLKRCIQLNYNSGKWSDVECGSANQVLCQLDLPWTAHSKQIKTLQDHIKTLETELALKANETELDEVQTSIVTLGTSVDIINTQVTDIKADYIKNEDIEAVEAQIAQKLDDLGGIVDNLSANISALQSEVGVIDDTYVKEEELKVLEEDLTNALDLKADDEEVDKLTLELGVANVTLWGHSSELGQLNLSVSNLTENVELVSEALKVIDTKLENIELNTTGSLDELRAHIDSGLLTKADQSSFVDLSGKVDTLALNLTELQTEIGVIDETFVKEDELRDVQAALIIAIDQKADDVSLSQVKIDVEAANEIIKEHTTELEQLGSRVSNLSLSVDDSIIELREYVDTKAEKEDLTLVRRTLISLGDDVIDLTDDFKVVESNYVDKDKLNTVESKLQVSIDLKADQTVVDTLNASMIEVQGKVEKLVTELSDLTDAVTPELTELKQEVLDLQASDIGTNATIDTFRETVNDNLAEKADAREVVVINGIIGGVQNNITEIKDDVTKISQEYVLADEALRQEADRLRVLVDAKAEKTYLDEKVTELQTEDTNINTKLGDVEKTVITLGTTLDKAGEDIKTLKVDVYDLTEEDKTINRRVGTLETHVDESLALKADQAAVDNSLALKADQTAVDNSLALKADQTAVDDISVALRDDIQPKLIRLSSDVGAHNVELVGLGERVQVLEGIPEN